VNISYRRRVLIQHVKTDVLVVGTGGAGMRAAIEAARQGVEVTVLAKGPIRATHTRMSGGRFNAVSEDEEFTKRYTNRPVRHHTRVTVRTTDGRVFRGESGGELGDLSTVMTDKEVSAKFRRVADLKLGADRSEKVADMLWNIVGTADIATLPRELVLR
jgi:thioredoxin reductase